MPKRKEEALAMMPRGNQRRNQRIKSRFDAQNSGSDCETSDSEELSYVNDKELQKYFEIRPIEIFGRQDSDRVNLRKSLVQRHFRSLKQFASSTPARAGSNPFNKSSLISPIFHQKPFAISPTSEPSHDEPERPPGQRKNGGLKNAMQKSSQENSHRSFKKVLTRESSSETESSGVRKKSSTQRHNGGLKSATHRNAQEITRRRSFADKKRAQPPQDESTSESELPVDLKSSSATQRNKIATRSRISQKLESAELHRSVPNKKHSEVQSDSESESPHVHKRLRNKRRNGSLKIVTRSRASQGWEGAGHGTHRSFPDEKSSIRRGAQVLSNCERRNESSSESESTLKGPDVQRNNRTSQKLESTGPGTHRSLPDKNSIKERSRVLPDHERRDGSSSESEATLKGPDASRKLEITGSTHRSFADKKRERSQVLPDYERRREASSESETSLKRPDDRKIVMKRTPEKLEKNLSTHKSFADKKRERSQVLPDYERRRESSSESETSLKRPDDRKIVTNRTPEKLQITASTHRSFADKKRERSQVLPDYERRGEFASESALKERVVQKKPYNGSFKICGTSQNQRIPEADIQRSLPALAKLIGMHSPNSDRWQKESPFTGYDLHKKPSSGNSRSKILQRLESTVPDTQRSFPDKERSIRTNAQVNSDRKRQDESSLELERSDVDERPSRQRPTCRSTSEKRESDRQRSLPVSPQKRQDTTGINDDASVLKRGRAQAPKDESILTKSRSRRNQGSVLNNEQPEDVFLSNRKDDARRSTTTNGSNVKDYLTKHSEPGRDIQRITRKGAEKEANSDEDGKKNNRKKAGTPPAFQKEQDDGVRDIGNDKNKPLRDNRMKEIYKDNFYMSSQSEHNMSIRSDSDYNRIHSKVNLNTPPATESRLFEENNVSSELNRLNTLHASSSVNDFTRKANNINRVITNLKLSKKESLPLSRSKEVGDFLPSGSEDDVAEVERQRKTARNKSQVKKNIEPTQKTGKRKTATKKKEPPKKGAKTKVQKDEVVEACDSNSEAPTGLRRSKRERKERDWTTPGVFIYVNEKNQPIVTAHENKKKDKNKNNVRRQRTEVSVARRRRQQNSVEPLPGCSKERDKPIKPARLSCRDGDGELESEYEFTGRDDDDFFNEDEFSSLGSMEREQRRKTKHLNMRINNSLYKIEWFNDGKQTLLDLESDTSNTSDTHVMHSIDVPSIATSGYVVIGPSGSKPPQLSRKYSLMFYVIEGTASVSLQDRFYVGGPSCNFFIPFGFEYTIRNLSGTKKLTLFCVRIPP